MNGADVSRHCLVAVALCPPCPVGSAGGWSSRWRWPKKAARWSTLRLFCNTWTWWRVNYTSAAQSPPPETLSTPPLEPPLECMAATSTQAPEKLARPHVPWCISRVNR
jgi:hypothetical protein